MCPVPSADDGYYRNMALGRQSSGIAMAHSSPAMPATSSMKDAVPTPVVIPGLSMRRRDTGVDQVSGQQMQKSIRPAGGR